MRPSPTCRQPPRQRRATGGRKADKANKELRKKFGETAPLGCKLTVVRTVSVRTEEGLVPPAAPPLAPRTRRLVRCCGRHINARRHDKRALDVDLMVGHEIVEIVSRVEHEEEIGRRRQV